MNPVAGIFLPWWGDPPGWERQFIERAAHSKSLKVILVGDAARWDNFLPRIQCTMDEFERRASDAAGVPIHKCDPRYFRGQALCELRPLMADMYPELIADYSWWGYGDWDVVWGDWDSFLNDALLSQFDMITSNPVTVNGPFVIYRNAPEINRLYRQRLDLVSAPDAHYLEEGGMEAIVRREAYAGRLRAFYPLGINSHDKHERWNRCDLRDNKLYRVDKDGIVGAEIFKFHFPATGHWPL